MLTRYIIYSIFIISSLFANDKFLEPQKAFDVVFTKDTNSVKIDLTLDSSIYVYQEFLKVTVKSNSKPQIVDITKELKLPIPKEYHSFKVYFDKLNIDIPYKLLETKNIDSKSFTINFEYQGCSKKGICYSPMSKSFVVGSTKASPKTLNETDSIAQTLQDGNMGIILITFFGFGLLLALTPCIFPMIPILSGIIVQQSKQNDGNMSASRGFFLSLVYVLSMSVAYTIAGVLAGLFGANIQAMLQNPYVISIFVAVFIALAFSMFGYYEISLPQSWQTKLNQTSENSSKNNGIWGIAIMGFLSALIVGPCVAPPLAASLVYIGQTGDAFLGAVALFVMSLGMGMPLLLIGLGAGKYMPKPGGWMMIVSKVFGVIMLGVAIWMLDKIVPFMVTIFLTMALLMGSAFYLLKQKTKVANIVASILVVVSIIFVVKFTNSSTHSKLHFKYIHSVKELDYIIAHSTQPIMLDFWAKWCVSCKELDNITFSDKMVQKRLSQYILLKVDVTKNTQDDKELMKRFNIFGPPALIFFENHKEVVSKRIIGFKKPKEFLKILSSTNK